MKLRLATINDAPTIWRLMDDHKAKFINDDEEITKGFALEIANSNACWVFADDNDYPVGGVWFDAVCKLHAMAHLVLDPSAYRVIKKAGLLNDVVTTAFAKLGCKKLKAFPNETQGNAIKILKALKFKQNGLFRNEVTVKGKDTDVYAFELHKKFWGRLNDGKAKSTNNHNESEQLLQPIRELRQWEGKLRQPDVCVEHADNAIGKRKDKDGNTELADIVRPEQLLQQPVLRQHQTDVEQPDFEAVQSRYPRPRKQFKRKKPRR